MTDLVDQFFDPELSTVLPSGFTLPRWLRRKPKPTPTEQLPDSLSDDLRNHLYWWLEQEPRGPRRWVMDASWLRECRRMLDADQRPVWAPSRTVIGDAPTLLGLPVTIRDDGGVPHLEPDPTLEP